jgi:hypothetical protein
MGYSWIMFWHYPRTHMNPKLLYVFDSLSSEYEFWISKPKLIWFQYL